MRDLLPQLSIWAANDVRCAIARVVDVDGSAPRQVGAAMAVNESGDIIGSVSGGCVEGEVVAVALDVISKGERRLVRFSYDDESAFSVGLTCGGTIDIFIEPMDWLRFVGTLLSRLQELVDSNAPAALVTLVRVTDPIGPAVGAKLLVAAGGLVWGTSGREALDRILVRDAIGELAAGHNATRHYGPDGQHGADGISAFIEVFAPPPRMIIFGAVDFTAALASASKFLGYDVTVCDARSAFATEARFPMADRVIADWPDRFLSSLDAPLGARDAVCVLTHDAKFDVPALVTAVASGVGYIGAMGNRRTHADREVRLREVGLDHADLARIHAPIGIDIGGRTPEETAISIVAEIISTRTGRTVHSLRDTDGPIH